MIYLYNYVFVSVVNWEIINFIVMCRWDWFYMWCFIYNFDKFFISIVVLEDLVEIVWGNLFVERDVDCEMNVMELVGDMWDEWNSCIKVVIDFFFLYVIS